MVVCHGAEVCAWQGRAREIWPAVVFVMRMEASSGLPAQCLQDFFFKPSVAKKIKMLTYG